MPPISNPPAVTLNVLRLKAEQASRLGGALAIDRQGQLQVKGTTWRGRAAIWLKDHLRPNAVRVDNQRLFQMLEDALPQNRPPAMNTASLWSRMGMNAHRVSSPAFARNYAAVARQAQLDVKSTQLEQQINRPYGTPAAPLAIPSLEEMEQAAAQATQPGGGSETEARASRAMAQTDVFAHKLLVRGPEDPVNPELRTLTGLAGLTGRSAGQVTFQGQAFAPLNKALANHLTDFASHLARDPDFASGRLPGTGSGPAHREADGTFSEDFLRGCLIVVMERSLPTGPGQPPAGADRPQMPVTSSTLGQLRQRYDAFMSAPPDPA